MVHPLYHRARGWIGQTVIVHHMNGSVHQGTLVGVEPHGIYVVPHRARAGLMCHQRDKDFGSNEVRLLDSYGQSLDAEHIYAPASYFAFGALAGLGLGAMAGGLYW